jgi:hypothetical protein
MKKLAIILAALVGLPFLAFQILYPTVTHRYRLTLVADDNGKPVTGSGVIEASYWKIPMFMLSHAEYGSRARGEAVVLDFGDKGMLFALLKGDDIHSDANWIARTAFGIERNSPPDEELRKLRSLTGKIDLKFNLLPILVRFRNIDDPKTVERVSPYNLAGSLGSGVTLVNATIEIARDPVTTGIEKRLPWLPGKKGKPGSITGAMSATPNRPELNLTGYEFSTEIFK